MPLSKKDIDLSNFLFRGKPSEQFPSKNPDQTRKEYVCFTVYIMVWEKVQRSYSTIL